MRTNAACSSSLQHATVIGEREPLDHLGDDLLRSLRIFFGLATVFLLGFRPRIGHMVQDHEQHHPGKQDGKAERRKARA